jgi:hypothetical protein
MSDSKYDEYDQFTSKKSQNYSFKSIFQSKKLNLDPICFFILYGIEPVNYSVCLLKLNYKNKVVLSFYVC